MIKGTGIDIIEISRIAKAVERWGDDFIAHIFTPSEIAHAKKFKFPYPHYAGRFAAKEAVFKAVGDAHLAWKDIEVINDASGQPVCNLKKPGFEHKIFLTISHSKDYAVAQAIVEA